MGGKAVQGFPYPLSVLCYFIFNAHSTLEHVQCQIFLWVYQEKKNMVTFEEWDAWGGFGFLNMLIGKCDFSKISILTKFKEEWKTFLSGNLI